MPDARKPTPLPKPRTGLLAVATVTESATVQRFANGLTWHPERVPNPTAGTTVFAARELKCVVASLPTTDGPVNEEAYPFSIVVYDKCSTFDDASEMAADRRDRTGRALRLLEAVKSYVIAKEFWTGAISTAQGLSNTWLKKDWAGDEVLTAAAAAKAIGKLDEITATRMTNGRGMFHMNPKLLAQLLEANVIRREGSLWLSPNDNVIVADGGYSGTVGATQDNIVATTPVEIWMRDPYTNEPVDGFTRTTNDLIVWAQQDVIVMHEPHILHASVAVS